MTPVADVLMLAGSSLMLLAAVGIVRMPDLFTRMQATTKAASLGVVLVLAAVALDFRDWGIAARALAAVVFILLTAPIAAHLLGRAAYLLGVPVWSPADLDELRVYFAGSGREQETAEAPPPPSGQSQARPSGHEGAL